MENVSPLKEGDIVLIDDNKDDLFLMEHAFHALGITNKLLTFDNAVDALNYLKSNVQPMLIICDVDMPTMGGLELRQKLYENSTLRRKCIPFIFLTGGDSEVDIELAFEFSVQGFFQKTTNFDECVRLLEIIITYWRTCKFPHNIFKMLVETKPFD